VANAFSAGEQVVVVRGGKFGERWAELCEAYGVEALCIDVEWGRAVELEAVREAFARAPEARALLVQAAETSTGVCHPIRELCGLVHEQPGRLIVVDGISAVGVHDLPMDAWGIDVLISGSQKSWMLPPGMAFIALSEEAERAVRASRGPRYYLDLRKALESQVRNQTAFSAPVSMLAGLAAALQLMLDEGLPEVFARHRGLALMTRAASRALGLELFAPDAPAFCCTTVKVPEGIDAGELIRRLRDVYGITVAGGQGRAAGKILRVGHMGDVDGFDVLSAVAALEMALADLGIPVKLGEGTRAATEILRDLLSREVH